jgi:hypothetical protein
VLDLSTNFPPMRTVPAAFGVKFPENGVGGVFGTGWFPAASRAARSSFSFSPSAGRMKGHTVPAAAPRFSRPVRHRVRRSLFTLGGIPAGLIPVPFRRGSCFGLGISLRIVTGLFRIRFGAQQFRVVREIEHQPDGIAACVGGCANQFPHDQPHHGSRFGGGEGFGLGSQTGLESFAEMLAQRFPPASWAGYSRRHLPAKFCNGVLTAARAGHLLLLELREETYKPIRL